MSHHKVAAVTGGGTGGHVFPALAIAEELQKRGISVIYIGSSHGMEAKLVPERKIPFLTVSAGAVKNQGILKIFKSLFTTLRGVLTARRLLKEHQVEVVIGVGGYVSVPVCFAAVTLGIPVFLQEQNASVGIANRVLGKIAKKIFLGFAQGKEAFNPRKCVVTGNPLRPVFFSSAVQPIDPKRESLLILGGSQGAKAINSALLELLPRIYEKFPSISIVHQTGQSDCEKTSEEYKKLAKGTYKVVPFISDMVDAYNQASLVIARSGALTVSELIQVGRPAIFVPYPRQGQNDQTVNAAMVANAGAAKVVEQGDQFVERLWKALETSFLPPKLEEMSHHYCQLRSPNGLATIGDHVERVFLK